MTRVAGEVSFQQPEHAASLVGMLGLCAEIAAFGGIGVRLEERERVVLPAVDQGVAVLSHRADQARAVIGALLRGHAENGSRPIERARPVHRQE